MTLTINTDYTDFSWEKTQEVANKMGLKIVFPEHNELFVDLDSEEAVKVFGERLILMEKFLPKWVKKVKLTDSKTPGHKHATVTLNYSPNIFVMLFLQILLGSDPKRELLSYKKLQNSHPYPVVFFEKE